MNFRTRFARMSTARSARAIRNRQSLSLQVENLEARQLLAGGILKLRIEEIETGQFVEIVDEGPGDTKVGTIGTLQYNPAVSPFTDFNISSIQIVSNRTAVSSIGTITQSGTITRSTTSPGTRTLVITASDSDFTHPIQPTILGSSATTTFTNATALDTVTFQSFADAVPSGVLTFAPNLLVNPSSKSSNATPVPLTIPSPFSLKNIFVVNLGPSTGSDSQTTVTYQDSGTTTVVGTNLLAALGDFVWHDLNANGVQDDGEPGIAGVAVNLLDAGGAVIDTTTTDGDGLYGFTGLVPGTYSVQFATPTGYAATAANIASVDGDAGDSDSVGGFTGAYTLVGGETNDTIDAGFLLSSGSIRGTKYHDLTGNGLTGDDTGLGGVTIYLDANNNGSLTDGEIFTTTAADGSYAFNGLAPGTYIVREVVGTDWIRTGPTLSDKYVVTVSAGDTSGGNDFANAEKSCGCSAAALSSLKYFVTPAGGTKTQISDLRGRTNQNDLVTVTFTYNGTLPKQFTLVSYTAPAAYFDANTAAQQEIYEVSTIIAQPGQSYTLSVRNPNSYYQVDFFCGAAIDHFGPAGSNIFYTPQKRLISADNDGTQAVAPGKISGYVYVDIDNDGNKDSGEAGIQNVLITLTGTDFEGNAVTETTTTISSGYYAFTDLRPGTYSVEESQPSAFLDGKDKVGTVNGLTSGSSATNDLLSGIAMIFNGTGSNYNFGELRPALISGFAFVDSDSDGHKDSGEAGLAGVAITLSGTDDLGNTVSIPSTTAADGSYSFGNLRPGTYSVSEGQPAGYSTTRNSVGSAGGNLATVTTDVITAIKLDSGENGTSYNFGERATSSAGGLVEGDTATIGFWNNKNGQALIKSLNGGSSSKKLATWLATNFSYLYGANAGSANNLTGKTNTQVAALFKSYFSVSGQKTSAQTLAVALAVYVTDSDLAGTSAVKYGFNVSSSGTGAKTYNVGSNGSAIGLSDNKSYSVFTILQAANQQKKNGTFNSNAFNTIFDGINRKGDI